MDSFVTRKRLKLGSLNRGGGENDSMFSSVQEDPNNSTDLKLAILASLHPDTDHSTLLDVLIASDGSVEQSNEALSSSFLPSPKRKSTGGIGHQTSLANFRKPGQGSIAVSPPAVKLPLTRKGQTLHLYTPEDIEAHTPCSIIHDFLPSQVAEDLLRELMQEAVSFERQTFKMFDNLVQSPHSACFYVENLEERQRQKTEYLYNGSFLGDVREITTQMRGVSELVKTAVNEGIAQQTQRHYPGGKKLKYQSPHEWVPNAAFVNLYDGGKESVGYHSDQLTYLGPRAVIGSLSLGVARQFRVRRIVAKEIEESKAKPGSKQDTDRADAEGQIAIHLPHNSLLVMHSLMQEEWKHSIAPALVIDPHPVAGNKRINSECTMSSQVLHKPFVIPLSQAYGQFAVG
ncbi:MAG: hypothetical protein Q9220_004234 [cf. Caloplaca sp. 1 TL-2023]